MNPVLTSLLTLLLAMAQGALWAQPDDILHIASFNIHYTVPADEDDDWTQRRHAVTRVLQEMDADIVAFQEMETFEGSHYSQRNLQLDWVLATVPGYKTAASGDPAVFPNTQPIIYLADKYSVSDQGFFFFSETPDRIYSPQWDGRYPYFCSWALFRDTQNEQEFYVFNVHNDYKSRANRLKTSRLIAERIEPIMRKGMPVIVVGDFNAPHWFKELDLLEDTGLRVVPSGGATNRLLGMNILPAIDHILISDHFRPQSDIKVWRKRYDGIYPGDHYPISVELAF